VFQIILLLISVIAGTLGSILGIGGGMIIVPVLTLFLNIDIRYAIAASLISIVATSSGAAASFLKDQLTNIRVAIFLEVGTVFGAMTGFLISNQISSAYLYFVFGFFLVFSAIMMFRKRENIIATANHPWADKLNLSGTYPDSQGRLKVYNVAQAPFALFLMYFAGLLSALLGIGSGILKVLAMDGAMKLPLKVSSATSNFMIGVTATASAGAYLLKGDVKPDITAPVAIGVIAGSWIGARLMIHMKPEIIRKIFVVLLVLVSIQMILKGYQSL